MNAREREMFERAKKAGYLLKSSRDPEIAWYEWCRRHNHPCLVIRTRRKYANLWLDLFPTDHDLSKEAIATLWTLLKPFPSTFWGKLISTDTVRCDRFPINKAQFLAREVLNIVDLDRKQNPLTLARPIERIEG